MNDKDNETLLESLSPKALRKEVTREDEVKTSPMVVRKRNTGEDQGSETKEKNKTRKDSVKKKINAADKETHKDSDTSVDEEMDDFDEEPKETRRFLRQRDKLFLEQDRKEKDDLKNWDLGMTSEEQEEYRRCIMSESMDLARGSSGGRRMATNPSTSTSSLETIFAGSYRIIMMIVMAFIFKSLMKKMKEGGTTK